MKNLWPEKFEEDQRITPKSLLEEQAKLLPSITEGIVYAEVSPMSAMDVVRKSVSLTNTFAFRFDILGKFLENYRFNVLCFSHDITLYPVKIFLDEGIGKELGSERNEYEREIESPEELENFLRQVLQSERLKSIVGSIVRLSH